jgi:hypothetical protein
MVSVILRGSPDQVEDIKLVRMGEDLFATLQWTEEGKLERTIWTGRQVERLVRLFRSERVFA